MFCISTQTSGPFLKVIEMSGFFYYLLFLINYAYFNGIQNTIVFFISIVRVKKKNVSSTFNLWNVSQTLGVEILSSLNLVKNVLVKQTVWIHTLEI